MRHPWSGVALLVWLCLATAAQAQSSVWKVSLGDNYLYIGGTIHLLTPADFPLPPAFDQAYGDADRIVLEADLGTVQQSRFLRELLLQTTYSGDGSVLQDLSKETVLLLRAHLNERGIPPASLFRLKPGMLSITLTVLELRRLGFTEAGVDQHYLARAQQDRKALGYLESLDSQVGFLVNMGKGQEDQLIQHTLAEMEALPAYMDVMRNAWRTGDLEQLRAVGLDPWVEQFPQLYDEILVKRNHNWLPEIRRLLATGETELVLFGAMHLVGDDGVLALLEDLGYGVQRLP